MHELSPCVLVCVRVRACVCDRDGEEPHVPGSAPNTWHSSQLWRPKIISRSAATKKGQTCRGLMSGQCSRSHHPPRLRPVPPSKTNHLRDRSFAYSKIKTTVHSVFMAVSSLRAPAPTSVQLQSDPSLGHVGCMVRHVTSLSAPESMRVASSVI